MMKILSLIVSFSLIVAPMPVLAQAAPEKIQKDRLQLGQASSAAAKEIIFDTNDGASNKKISINKTTKKITIDTAVDVTGAVGVTGSATATGDATIDGTVTGKTGVKLGSGTNASKQITVDRAGFDPFMKWNETTGKWTYSNDGSVEKNIGSGSGGEGGVNILQNPSFEDGIAVDWTSSGGTFSSQTYTNPDPSGNDSIYSRFVSTIAGQYFESTVHATPSFLTGGCLAKINYNTTDAANWRLQVYDNSSNLLAQEYLYVRTWANGYVSFPCPTVGTSIKLRVISLGAGTIESDKAYLGNENRTASVQIPDTDTVAYTPIVTVVSGTMTNYVASGSWYRDGEYLYGEVRVSFSGAAGTWSGVTFSIPSGLSIDATKNVSYSNLGPVIFNDVGSQDYRGIANMSSSTTIGYFYDSVSTHTGVAPILNAGGTNLLPFTFFTGDSIQVKYKVPIVGWRSAENLTALRPEAQDWMIDANIGGGTASLGFVDVSSYSEIVSSTWDMVLNTGSAAAKIPCSTTNASTGLTCSSGNESVGATFTNPAVGFYEACIDFTHQALINGVGSRIDTEFQIVETTPSTQTIIQEGKTRTGIFFQNDVSASNSIGGGGAVRNCGTFYFGSVAERTLRLMYEQDITASVTANVIHADRGATVGQRDIHIVVRPLLSAYNRPYLLGKPIGFAASNMSAFSVPNNVDTPIGNWTINDQQGGSNFNATTGVFTSPQDAFYIASSKIGFNSHAGTNGYCNLQKQIGGAGAGAWDFVPNYAGGANVKSLSATASIYLPKGATLFVACYQLTGSSQVLQSSASNLVFFTVSKSGQE